jgi:hypothetical protein
MSETTGWRLCKRKRYYKFIKGELYELDECEDGLYSFSHQPQLVQAYKLADAKRAAHRHAEGSYE